MFLLHKLQNQKILMSLAVTSRNPKALLTAIKTAVINEVVPAWTIVLGYDKVYFTLTEEQWKFKALLGYTIVESGLIFTITSHNDSAPDEDTKKVYYERFSEMLKTHFKGKFTTIQTGLP